MTDKQLVLASESPYRRELLDRLRIPYQARPHKLDERHFEADKPPGQPHADLALALAIAKAESLAAEEPQAFIIASDQLAVLDGEILHKPGGRVAAMAQLNRLAGRRHELLTAVALRSPGAAPALARVHKYRMQMRQLSEEEIERYVDADTPFDCCGSYKIESLGITLFEGLAGDDFTAIMGLPLIALTQMLRSAGFCVP